METGKVQLRRIRWAVNVFFFFYGFLFATWASRIPAIQQQLNLSDAKLGLVLLGMPLGSFIALPFSGIFTSKHGSKVIIIISSFVYCVLLPAIGFTHNIFGLSFLLFLFGAAGNVLNIAINTQAISLEKLYGRSIISSFHGMWSVAGLVAAFAGTIFIAHGLAVSFHFLITALLAAVSFIAAAFFLLKDTPSASRPGRWFTKPDRAMISLGIIAFCSFICQGAMFDWSGIYFKKIVSGNSAFTGFGYTAFMVSMTSVRFITDWLNNKFGFYKIIFASGFFIMSGLALAVFFPYLITATLGMFLVGVGVSPAVPLVFSAAGRSGTMAPPVAIAAVSSIGMIGLLIGPPVVGFISGLFSLKISFLILSVFGLAIIVVAVSGMRKSK
ncbi:MAG: MFS transporter [Ginsengibacter sp.]